LSTYDPGVITSMTMHCSTINHMEYNLYFWDTPGEERFNSVLKINYRDCKVYVMVFALDEVDSLTELDRFFSTIEEQKRKEEYVIVVGNKLDLAKSEVRELAQLKWNNMNFILTSASSGEGIPALLDKITQLLDKQEYDIIPKSVNLSSEEPIAQKRCC